MRYGDVVGDWFDGGLGTEAGIPCRIIAINVASDVVAENWSRGERGEAFHAANRRVQYPRPQSGSIKSDAGLDVSWTGERGAMVGRI